MRKFFLFFIIALLPLSTSGLSARETVPLAFVRIEAEKFQRGGLEHDEDEITVHNVHISQHFLISDHEVTLWGISGVCGGHRVPQ